MDIINELATHLEQTLNPNADIRKSGENFLEEAKGSQKNYGYLLFSIAHDLRFSDEIQQIASVELKNWIKCNWVRYFLNSIYKSKWSLYNTVCIIYVVCQRTASNSQNGT